MFNLIKNHEDFCSSPWITMDFVCAFSFTTLTTLKPPKDWRLLLSSIVSSDSLIFFEARVSESSLCRFGALEAAIFSSLKPTIVVTDFNRWLIGFRLVARQRPFGNHRAWRPCCVLPVGTPSVVRLLKQAVRRKYCNFNFILMYRQKRMGHCQDLKLL